MAKYKGIKGFKVQSLASDPTADEGQIWYNTTGNVLKYDHIGAGAWASAGNLDVQRYRFSGGFGTATTAVMVGGIGVPGYAPQVTAEEYNGSAWTELTGMPTGTADAASIGTPTAGMTTAGNSPGITNKTQLWNGASWSAGNTLPWSAERVGCTGTQTAALATGGYQGAPGYTANSAEWNGTSWTLGNAFPASNSNLSMCGTQTAGLGFGGYNPGLGGTGTYDYDGVNWSVNPATMATTRGEAGYSTKGTNTAAMAVDGAPSSATKATEQFNGTTWTEIADVSTGRSSLGSAGTTDNMIIACGSPNTTAAEEWNGAPASVKTVTVT